MGKVLLSTKPSFGESLDNLRLICRNFWEDLRAIVGGYGLRSTYSASPVTSSTTLTALDYRVRVDCTSAAVTLTLPAASLYPGKLYHIKKIDASANAVVIACAGSDVIDGSASVSLPSQYDNAHIGSYGSGWDIL